MIGDWNWWKDKSEAESLLKLTQDGKNTPLYVYSDKVIRKKIRELKSLGADRYFFAVKANFQPDVLKIFYDENIGFECVSPGELDYILQQFPNINRNRIIYTPNFIPKEEYAYGFSLGVSLIIDSHYPILHWPDLFQNKSIMLRIDTGTGRGHHDHVKTAGVHSKFGIIPSMCEALSAKLKLLNCKVVGLHAHTGSGILEPHNWIEVANALYSLVTLFPDVKVLNLGGGLGVVQNPDKDVPLDLHSVSKSLAQFQTMHKEIELWMEPGRFLVAESGVLLTKITQIKTKDSTKHFVGVNAGFNSLMRPILYGAHHPIHNLSRPNEPLEWRIDLVGMICESGDVFAENRPFPRSQEGDVVLIATAGAYGRSMASEYNMRKPAPELLKASL